MKLRLALFAGFFLTLFLAAVQESMAWMAVCTLCLTAFVVSALARPAGVAAPSREQRTLWRKYREIVSGCYLWRRDCLVLRGRPGPSGTDVADGDPLGDVMLDVCMSGPRPGLSDAGRAVVEGMMLARAMGLCVEASGVLDEVYPAGTNADMLASARGLARRREAELYEAYRRLVSEGKLYQRSDECLMNNQVNSSKENFDPPTVAIGNQVWMAMNLAVDDGGEGITYKPENDETYYTWEAAMRVANSIPGWHLPTAIEWNEAALACGASEIPYEDGSNPAFNDYESDQELKDKLGIKLAGYYLDSFYNVGTYACFWTSTEYSSSSAYARRRVSDGTSMGSFSRSKVSGYSVRLVKDSA